MDHLSDEEALHAVLDANPSDRVARGALADLYRERGDEDMANALQWLAERRRYPFGPAPKGYGGPDAELGGKFGWGNGIDYDVDPRSYRYAYCALPGPLYYRLVSEYPRKNWFLTRRDAEGAIGYLWGDLSPEEMAFVNEFPVANDNYPMEKVSQNVSNN